MILIIRHNGNIEAVIQDATAEDAQAHIDNGYPHLSGYPLDIEELDADPEDYTVNGVLFSDAESKKHTDELKRERDRLELDTARGFLWLVKKLLANGTIQMADIPAKLIDYKNRIEEIEAEIGGA